MYWALIVPLLVFAPCFSEVKIYLSHPPDGATGGASGSAPPTAPTHKDRLIDRSRWNEQHGVRSSPQESTAPVTPSNAYPEPVFSEPPTSSPTYTPREPIPSTMSPTSMWYDDFNKDMNAKTSDKSLLIDDSNDIYNENLKRK